MMLNKSTEYAITVLGYMTTSEQQVFSAEYLYQELKIPRIYLRQLMTTLSKLGFVKSTKGRNGGFEFAQELENISLAKIIESVEGTESLTNCILGFSECKLEMPCIMHEAWSEAKTKMIETLRNTTLANLRNKYLENNQITK